MKALMVSSLSAKGSKKVPKTLISLRLLAKYPSKGSVAQANTKMDAATNLAHVASGIVKPIKTGTRISRNTVILLARVIVAAFLELGVEISARVFFPLGEPGNLFLILAQALLEQVQTEPMKSELSFLSHRLSAVKSILSYTILGQCQIKRWLLQASIPLTIEPYFY
jgi:hypothetical protein